MVQNINKLKGKITENGYTIKTLASEVGLCETSLRRKINDKSEFTLNETLKVKDKLHLTSQDYLDIFFGTQLEFNS
jgi:hypothetical protein